MADAPKPRLLTGDRPTGPLHLGHLVGSLDNRVALQHDHECFIIVADLHTLTTRPRKQEILEVPQFVHQIVLDQLAVGLDPAKVTFYLQSGVPAVYDLAILLQMLVPKSRLEQVKSLRNMARAAAMPDDAMTMGLLAYPVLQAADILMARATIVPVGLDNEEHIIIARECAMVFNELYGDLFPLPQARISTTPALPGVGTGAGGSGAKMSKSLGNAVYLGDSPEEVRAKIATIEHGDGDKRLGDDAPLVAFARAFVGDEGAGALRRELDAGTTTVAAAHALVTDAIEKRLAPIRSRRAELGAEKGLVEEILVDGTIRAREIANQTLQRTREAMGLEALWSGLVAAHRSAREGATAAVLMGVTPTTIARMRSTVGRHLRRGFVRAVFAQPGSEGEGDEVVEGDGKPPGETEMRELLRRATVAAKAGLVKHTWIIDARTRLVVDARHGAGKLVALDEERADKMMGGKDLALRPDRSGDLLRTIGIMNADGTVSTKHAKKYKQITHFMELCRPVWAAIAHKRQGGKVDAEHPLRVVDLGCGNGYLTFVIAEALRLAEIPAQIHGVDVREDVIDRATERAQSLGWAELSFARGSIDAAHSLFGGTPDLLVALHACDTATDDAIALGIEHAVPTMLVAPCCQHELAAQISAKAVESLSPAIASQGLLRQDFAATLTDALRIDVLEAMGWSVDTLEFVGDTHTPKNLLIRATLRGRVQDVARLDRIRERCAALGVTPRLLARLGDRPTE